VIFSHQVHVRPGVDAILQTQRPAQAFAEPILERAHGGGEDAGGMVGAGARLEVRRGGNQVAFASI